MTQKGMPTSFRLRAEVKVALEQAAQADHRSVSSLLDLIVTQWLRDKGHMPQIRKP